MKVDFFVPGFSKCGTTTLCALLAEHPQVFIPAAKEPSFFAQSFQKGWQWYGEFFDGAGENQVVGEGSTFYSSAEFAKTACTRILQYFPDARFLFIARNPVQRVESSYRELHHSGPVYGVNAPYSMGEALRSFPNLIEDTLYWQRLSTFRAQVPDNRILAVLLEDLQSQPAAELARCFAFLGVDPSARIENAERRLNAGGTKMYDSRLMRFLRARRWIFPPWDKLSDRWKARVKGWLRLRKPFTTPVAWDTETRAWFVDRIGGDARQFLAYCGKPPDFWNLESC